MSKRLSLLSCLIAAGALAATPAAAHGPNDPPHQSFCMGDLKLESGGAIKDFWYFPELTRRSIQS